MLRREPSYTNEFLEKGDKPWYCFWNQTVEEFWIFLEKKTQTGSVSAAAAMTSVPSGYPKTASPSTPESSSIPTGTPVEVPLEAETAAASASPTPSTWYGPKGRRKRGDPSSSGVPASGTHPIFPNMIKMVEKRKPHENIDPYCQQMQVLDNWMVVPIPGVDIVEIDEAEFEDYRQGTSKARRSLAGSRGQSLVKRDEEDIISDLESLCICEWRAG